MSCIFVRHTRSSLTQRKKPEERYLVNEADLLQSTALETFDWGTHEHTVPYVAVHHKCNGIKNFDNHWVQQNKSDSDSHP